MINILIPEEIPSLNKGEAAILEGMLESFSMLREEVRVTIFSFDPETDAARYGSRVTIINANGIMPKSIMFRSRRAMVKIFEYLIFYLKHLLFISLYKVIRQKALRFFKSEAWKYYIDIDLAIMAHNSAFAIHYHPFLVLFLKSLKKKVIFYSATIPSFRKEKACYGANALLKRQLLKFVLKRVDLITVREKTSFERLKGYGLESIPLYLTADFAFLLRCAPDSRVRHIMRRERLDDMTPLIGVTLSRNQITYIPSDNGSFDGKYSKFTNGVKMIIDYLTHEIQATVVFIPHCIGPDKDRDDRILAQEIYKTVNDKSKVRVIVNEYSPEELRGLTGKFDLCIGTRVHSIIDALCMLVPSVAITNGIDTRVHGIVGEMLGQKEWIWNLETSDYQQLISIIGNAWAKRNEIKKGLEPAVKRGKEKALENGMILSDFVKKTEEKDVLSF